MNYPSTPEERRELEKTIQAVKASTKRIEALTMRLTVRQQLDQLNALARAALGRLE